MTPKPFIVKVKAAEGGFRVAGRFADAKAAVAFLRVVATGIEGVSRFHWGRVCLWSFSTFGRSVDTVILSGSGEESFEAARCALFGSVLGMTPLVPCLGYPACPTCRQATARKKRRT